MTTPKLLRLPLRATPWPPGDNAATDCPVCGAYWKPWAGSILPCHACCLMTPDGGRHCRKLWRESDMSVNALAENIGVPVGVVKATLRRRFGIRCAGQGGE